MRRRTVQTLLVMVAVAAVASASLAQVKKEESVNFAVTGKILGIDAKAGTLTVKGANDDGGVYQVNAMTTIMSGNSGIELSQLKVGDSVVLNGDTKGENKVATYIEVVDAP